MPGWLVLALLAIVVALLVAVFWLGTTSSSPRPQERDALPVLRRPAPEPAPVELDRAFAESVVMAADRYRELREA